MMMRKKFGTILIIVGVVLMCSALGIVVGNIIEQRNADVYSQNALGTLIASLPDTEVFQGDSSDSSSIEVIPDYILNPNMNMPEIEIDGVKYIGYLEIPALELQLPIISKTTGKYLQLAPCRFEGSAYIDNLVIGAHNYARHFGNIGDLKYGDTIKFTDMDGNVFTYQVANIEILQPNQGVDLCSGEWPLTLYTCTIGGRTRVTVRCEKVEA